MPKNLLQKAMLEVEKDEIKAEAQAKRDKRYGEVMGYSEVAQAFVKNNKKKLAKKYGNNYIAVRAQEVIGSSKDKQKLLDSIVRSGQDLAIDGILVGKVEGIVRYNPSTTARLVYHPYFAERDRRLYGRWHHSCM